eukprot:comp22749_c0_seq3/m.35489 comp22749_c0_seq3/g.35489  ORF comp22749_c0_seq3/g.35489 comp22749_c0_seq3/m.35489 type:complete len:273 (-) comp22749_c0_seq3:31-849(-)
MPLKCYNKACGQDYEEADNSDTSCTYHPGGPVFHEGLKGWSCCKKRVTDFSDFLSMPGCTQGRHSNVKPEPPPAATQQASHPAPIPSPHVAADAPPLSTEFMEIKLEQSAPARTQFESFKAKWLEDQQKALSSEIAEGAPCNNKGCRASYPNTDTCYFHPGNPVFHEGMKYWSCCERKTSDFQNFLDQSGCTDGDHTWREAEGGKKAKANCRYDYFQGGNWITMNIYAKHIDPEHSTLKLSEGKLVAHLVFEATKIFDLELNLKGELSGVLT